MKIVIRNFEVKKRKKPVRLAIDCSPLHTFVAVCERQ